MDRVTVIGGGHHRGHRSWEKLGQQRLVCVAVSAECSGNAQQGGHTVPTQVLWGKKKS